VDVARALGKQTVAEFVGNQRTVELLRQYGVDYAQGYYIGRPRAVESVIPEARPLLRAA
jgi:EAL domain-containing protein (putative c-di-GMP-specific phosphodiesterase class I)